MGQYLKWSSQPQYEKIPVGNVLTLSLIMSDISFKSFIKFCSAFNLNMFTRTIFDKHENRYFAPVINVGYKQQNEILEKVRKSSDNIRLAGNG